MFGHSWYNGSFKRYVAVFGTLFNDIKITRSDNDGDAVQSMVVPLSYAPMQKALASITQNPSLDGPAIVLPRMSFEIVNVSYDSTRKTNQLNHLFRPIANNVTQVSDFVNPTPYNIDIELTIYTKYFEDGMKILEQILPFFTPHFTPSVKMIDGVDMTVDIPIILNTVNQDISYQGSPEDRSVMMWTLSFTIKGYLFGPAIPRKLIKFANTNIYSTLTANDAVVRVTSQPGLTANGEPTTDANSTIDWSLISADDDWAYIVQIEDL